MSEINNLNIYNNRYFQDGLKSQGYSEYGTDNLSENSIFNNNSDSEIDNQNIISETEQTEKKPFSEAVFNDNGKIESISFYDENGELINTDDYTYDENGNTIERISINANNIIEMQENNEYYENGNKKYYKRTFYREDGTSLDSVETSYFENGQKAENTHIKYNKQGNPVKLNEDKYRENGTREIVKEIVNDDDGILSSKKVYSYNDKDFIIKAEHYNKNNNLVYKRECSYFEDNLLKSESNISYNDNGIIINNTDIEYNKDGLPTEYTQYDEDGNISYRIENIYDNLANNIEKIIYGNTGKVIQRTENKYDGISRTSSTTYNSAGEIKENTLYSYNDEGDIIGRITYNAEGNIISETNYTYDENYNAHEYTQIYDNDGNTVFDFEYEYSNIWDYSYDSEQYIADVKSIYAGNMNGEIEYTQQGIIGDCWLLAGVNSLSYSQKGQDILKNAVNYNKDRTFTVNFKGIDKSVTITEEELKEARESSFYSNGDDDMLILELGFESIIHQIQEGDIKIDDNHNDFLTIEDGSDSFVSVLDGGYFEDVIYLLTGNDVNIIKYNDENAENNINDLLDKFIKNPQSFAVSFGLKAEIANHNAIVQDINDDYIYEISRTGHAFSLKSADENTVTIVNPGDSSKEYVISRENFIKYVNDVQYYEVT